MKPIDTMPYSLKRAVRYILTDVDDTLTLNGQLPASALAAMEKAADAGIRVVPVTGGPAGWCDHMARCWPVAGVIGENGAFYFYYDRRTRTMSRRYWQGSAERRKNRQRLTELAAEITAAVPGCIVSADQGYRDVDLAIDYCADVPALPFSEVERIIEMFQRAGAHAKMSSIHVNGWYGDFDKLQMAGVFFREILGLNLDEHRHSVLYVGDAPNDAPMFGYFPQSVGVANIRNHLGRLHTLPAWVTQGEGGEGFAELVGILLRREPV